MKKLYLALFLFICALFIHAETCPDLTVKLYPGTGRWRVFHVSGGISQKGSSGYDFVGILTISKPSTKLRRTFLRIDKGSGRESNLDFVMTISDKKIKHRYFLTTEYHWGKGMPQDIPLNVIHCSEGTLAFSSFLARGKKFNTIRIDMKTNTAECTFARGKALPVEWNAKGFKIKGLPKEMGDFRFEMPFSNFRGTDGGITTVRRKIGTRFLIFPVYEIFYLESPKCQIQRERPHKYYDPVFSEYANLLKVRGLLEKQMDAAGIPYDRESACRFYGNGSLEDTEKLRDLQRMVNRMTDKMPPELPERFPDEKLRKLRTGYLASIAQDWKAVCTMLAGSPQIKPAWDPRKKLVDQILSMPYRCSRELARIFLLQMQAKADAGDIAGALTEFERSRLLLDLDGSLLAVLVAAAIEHVRLDGLSCILSRGELSPEQLKQLDDSLQKEEVLFQNIWRRAWYLECACGLDVIATGIEKIEQIFRESFLTPDTGVLVFFMIPLTREWIFTADFYRKILPELTRKGDYREFSFRKEFPERYVLCPDFIAEDIISKANNTRFYAIARIRAARMALRHLGLKHDSELTDPFTGKPFRVRKGEFMAGTKKACGIRFYSAGPDGRYADGIHLHPHPHCDDFGFDLIQGILPANSKQHRLRLFPETGKVLNP